VRDERGTGPTHQATIGRRAELAIAEAVEAARQAGVQATGQLLPGANPGAVLVERAGAADLLVVPINVESRASGIMVSSPSSTAVHKATVPVLVARHPSTVAAFPARMLVASDGSEDSHRALSIAGSIARHHGARVDLLRVDPGPHGDAHDLGTAATELAEGFGVEAKVIRESGHPVDRIVEVADRTGATLIVVGSRGVSGLRALGSVSERVVHRAHCSVLVARYR
jgi:nucleotide-binding universal stress UspA family protein